MCDIDKTLAMYQNYIFTYQKFSLFDQYPIYIVHKFYRLKYIHDGSLEVKSPMN